MNPCPILSLLTDDLLIRVRSKLTPRDSDTKCFRLVCKSFLRVDSLCRTSLRVLRPEFLTKLLTNFPFLQLLDLSVCPCVDDGMVALILNGGGGGGCGSSKSVAWTQGVRTLVLKRVTGLHYYGLEMLVRACWTRLEVVDVSHCCGFGDREAQALSFAAGLRELRLDKCLNITDVGLAHIAVGCCRLEKISLKWCMEITDLGIGLLTKKCTELKLLDISYLEVTNEAIRAIASLNKLEDLFMEGCYSVDDTGLYFLSDGCSLLKTLSVSRCDGISLAGLCSVVKRHQGLMQLNASHCVAELSLMFARYLKRLKHLNLLRIDGARLSQSALQIISGCESLVEIGLSKSIGLTDMDIMELVAGCINLKTVNLTCCNNISDSAITALINSCRNLTCLKLEACSLITEKSFELLGTYCIFLEELDLTDCCGVNDTGLSYLSRCSRLFALKLGLCTGISDKGLFFIASNCSNLLELDFYHCPGVGDDGFAGISLGCKKLRKLNVSYCTRLTDRGMEYIGRLEELSEMEMRGLVRITAAGLTALVSGCEKLTDLDIKHCTNILDPGFWSLAYYSKNLRQINLCCCAISDVALFMVMSSLTCLQDAKLANLPNVSVGGFELALKACCGRIKKVKMLPFLRHSLSQELLEALWSSGCKIRLN